MDINEVMLILNKGLKYDKLWADYNRRFRPETKILKLSERTPEQSLIDLQAKYDALQAINAKLVEALTEASHMIYGELYHDHPTVLIVKQALKEAEKIT